MACWVPSSGTLSYVTTAFRMRLICRYEQDSNWLHMDLVRGDRGKLASSPTFPTFLSRSWGKPRNFKGSKQCPVPFPSPTSSQHHYRWYGALQDEEFVQGLYVEASWNVMAHALKPDSVFQRNGRVHLNRRGRQFSRLLATEVCSSAVVMLVTPCSEVVWRVLATHSIRQFPLHFPSRASRCAITFQLDSTARPTITCNSVCLTVLLRKMQFLLPLQFL